MVRPAISCTITGDREICEKLRVMGKRGVVAAEKGVRITAIEILKDAKERLVKNGSRVTGKLFNSGKVTIDADDTNFTDVVFSGGGDGYTDYAEYVEFGRRAGKGLNEKGVEAVAQWAIKKGILHSYNIKTRRRSTAGTKDIQERARDFAIAYSGRLKKRGRKGTPFLFPAFEAKRNNLMTNIQKELQKLNDSYPNQ